MERPTWAGAKVLPLHWKPTDDEDGGHDDDDDGEGGLDEGDDDDPQEVEGLAGCWVPRHRLSTGAKTVRATGAACRFGSNSVFNLNKKQTRKAQTRGDEDEHAQYGSEGGKVVVFPQRERRAN